MKRIKVMADDRVVLRKKALEELKSAAFTELERRGYEVRGKTPAQIRQILKRRPTKPNPTLSQIVSRIAGGWIKTETKERIDVHPSHWREWEQTS
jgi:hypothetical protein